MRALLQVVLLVLSLLVSGCIAFQPPEPQPTPPSTGLTWTVVAPPVRMPDLPVLQFWVPPGASALRISWLDVPAVEEDDWTPVKAGHGRAGSLFDAASPRIVVLDPAGHTLELSGFEAPLDLPSGANGWNMTFAAKQHEQPDPTPGAHLVVLYGQAPLPTIELEVPAYARVAPLMPAPFAFQRTHVYEGMASFNELSGIVTVPRGTLQPPPRTLMAYGDLFGTAFDATVAFDSSKGRVAATRVSTLVSPPGWREATLGLDWPSGLTRFDEIQPEHLDGGEFRFIIGGLGTVSAHAVLGSATPLLPPFTPATAVLPAPGTEDAVELAGEIAGRAAKWFLAPPSALLHIESDDDATTHFRVYDLQGRRVHWGDVADQAVTVPLPEGPLVVANDGPATLSLALLGSEPSDATLHEVPTRIIEHEQTLDATGGHDTHTKRVHVAAPVLGWYVQAMPYLSNLQTVVLTPDSAALGSAPDLNAVRPGEAVCCPFPLFGYADGDARWLDGGAYLLRADASGGQGTVTHTFEVLDLAGIASQAEAVQAQQAEPQL